MVDDVRLVPIVWERAGRLLCLSDCMVATGMNCSTFLEVAHERPIKGIALTQAREILINYQL